MRCEGRWWADLEDLSLGLERDCLLLQQREKNAAQFHELRILERPFTYESVDTGEEHRLHV